MRPPLTFTLDLEDHRERREAPARYPAITREILPWLTELGVRGTFFVVGEVAAAEPGLIREVAAGGHEIALHSYDHKPLTAITPARFRDDTVRGRALLEDLIGQAVQGYRAPIFSLTPASRWAVGILAELGFHYSSSVLAARHPLYGYPGLPTVPFQWPEGLLEIPAPLARLGPARLPYLGGFYLRYLPLPLIQWLRERAPHDELPWGALLSSLRLRCRRSLHADARCGVVGERAVVVSPSRHAHQACQAIGRWLRAALRRTAGAR
jgi:polysaccharide deacetylase family protein (PEP-CTERM system associated)